jgi:hypothetical protein
MIINDDWREIHASDASIGSGSGVKEKKQIEICERQFEFRSSECPLSIIQRLSWDKMRRLIGIDKKSEAATVRGFRLGKILREIQYGRREARRANFGHEPPYIFARALRSICKTLTSPAPRLLKHFEDIFPSRPPSLFNYFINRHVSLHRHHRHRTRSNFDILL